MRVWGMVLAVGIAASLVGCSDDSEPRTLPPLTSATPSASVVPIPSEAVGSDAVGAAAFTKYFFAQVNASYASLDGAAIKLLSAPDCNSCRNIIEDIDRLRDEELSVAGDRFRLDFAESPPPNGDGSVIVDFQFDADPYVEVDRAGRIQRDNPAKVDQAGQAKLIRKGSSWLMSGLRLVDL